MSHDPDLQPSKPTKPKSEFEELDDQELSLLQEFLVFLAENKKWYLIPILAILSVVALLIVLSATGAAPFIYTHF